MSKSFISRQFFPSLFYFFFPNQSTDVVNLRFKGFFSYTHTHIHTPIYVFHWSLCFFLDPPEFQYIAHLCAKLSYSLCTEWKNTLFSTSAHFGGRRGGRVKEMEERPLEEFSYTCYFRAKTWDYQHPWKYCFHTWMEVCGGLIPTASLGLCKCGVLRRFKY